MTSYLSAIPRASRRRVERLGRGAAGRPLRSRDRPPLRPSRLVEQNHEQVKQELGSADFMVCSDSAGHRHSVLACSVLVQPPVLANHR